MKTQFVSQPICEVCKTRPAEVFTAYRDGSWKFCCSEDSDHGIYPLTIDRFFCSAGATVDWIAHLHEKNWMDFEKFAQMMRRFRKATRSFCMC